MRHKHRKQDLREDQCPSPSLALRQPPRVTAPGQFLELLDDCDRGPGHLLEAQVVVESWRVEYNTFRPHSGGLTPTEYAKT